MSVEFHPLDFEALEKGTWLEGEALVLAAGADPSDHKRWRLALLKLRQAIEEKTEILCCEDHDRIRLMTDSEAREHTWRRWRQNFKGLGRQVFRRSRVDLSQIPHEEHRRVESETRVMSGVTAAARARLRKEKRMELLNSGR